MNHTCQRWLIWEKRKGGHRRGLPYVARERMGAAASDWRRSRRSRSMERSARVRVTPSAVYDCPVLRISEIACSTSASVSTAASTKIKGVLSFENTPRLPGARNMQIDTGINLIEYNKQKIIHESCLSLKITV